MGLQTFPSTEVLGYFQSSRRDDMPEFDTFAQPVPDREESLAAARSAVAILIHRSK
jgi:hypothetical protein